MSALALEYHEPTHDRPAFAGDQHPLLLLHGFTQTSKSWGAFGRIVGADRVLVTVDLPGHGSSRDVRADLAGTAELLAGAIAEPQGTQSQGGCMDVLGYSLGARVALHLGLAHPSLVRRLVLISGTAGLVDADERQRRRERDDRLADELEATRDVGAFIDRWLSAPMFATLPGVLAEQESRLANTAPGLAASLRLAGLGTQASLWGCLPTLEPSLLTVTGATDVRFVEIGRRMAEAASGVQSVVPGAGHAVHLEQPATVARLVSSWLR